MQISQELNLGQSRLVTFDKQLYSKAKNFNGRIQISVARSLFALGVFILQNNFMKAIGQHYTDSGLKEVWAESLVFGENTATNNLLAKSYNRTIRTHKRTLEILRLIMWLHFQEWAEGQGHNELDIQRLSEHLAQSFNGKDGQDSPSALMKLLEDKVQTGHLLQLLEQYDETLPPTLFVLATLHEDGSCIAPVHTSRMHWQLADA